MLKCLQHFAGDAPEPLIHGNSHKPVRCEHLQDQEVGITRVFEVVRCGQCVSRLLPAVSRMLTPAISRKKDGRAQLGIEGNLDGTAQRHPERGGEPIAGRKEDDG
jgi:hypothetical protein